MSRIKAIVLAKRRVTGQQGIVHSSNEMDRPGAAPGHADAKKPFLGICEGLVQPHFFIDATVSVPVGKTQHERSIGRYKYLFTDPEISTVCAMV